MESGSAERGPSKVVRRHKGPEVEHRDWMLEGLQQRASWKAQPLLEKPAGAGSFAFPVELGVRPSATGSYSLEFAPLCTRKPLKCT